MNQIFLTGRIRDIEIGSDNTNLMIEIYQYSPDVVEYIPVIIDESSDVFIKRCVPGDLVSVVGRLKFENDGIKVIAEKINYAG